MFRISAERNEIRYQDDKEIYGLVLFLIRSKEEASDPDVIFDLHSTEIGLELAKVFDGETSFGHPALKGEKAWYLENTSPIFSSYLERLLDLLKSHKGVERAILRIGVDEATRRYFAPFRLSGSASSAAKNDISKALSE